MRNPLGVGVIGLGVGERHARAFADDPNCRLVGICDFDQSKLDEVAKRFPDVKRFATAERLIDDPEISIVSIASYDQYHCRQVVRALQHGKHVFVEKPLCLTAVDLEEIYGVWRKSRNLRLSTNTILRRAPRFQWLKRAVQTGQLGTVYCIEADYVYGRLHKLTDGWRGKIPDYSVMLGGGIHLVDLMLWVTGQRPVEVIAFASGLASRGSSYGGNDLALALLRFDSGLLVKLSANFAAVHPHYHRLIAYGTAATFENIPGVPARLWQSRNSDSEPEVIDAEYPGVDKGDMIPAFVNAVLGQGEPDVVESELFAAMSVCIAINRAITERRPVVPKYH